MLLAFRIDWQQTAPVGFTKVQLHQFRTLAVQHCAAMAGIESESAGLLESHGIGACKPPVNPAAAELFHDFCGRSETMRVGLDVENRFFRGFQHGEIDWNKPVHGLLVDFKGDSMQIGMILERLEASTLSLLEASLLYVMVSYITIAYYNDL